MAVYLCAVLFLGAFCILGIAFITRIEPKPPRRDTRALGRLTQENAPQPQIQPQAGDFSALAAGSIEGTVRYD